LSILETRPSWHRPPKPSAEAGCLSERLPSHRSLMLQDIRFAIRTLVKAPAFTTTAILCLALGIGVNATIFSCVRAMLLRPFPYRDPDALVAIGEANTPRGWHMN